MLKNILGEISSTEETEVYTSSNLFTLMTIAKSICNHIKLYVFSSVIPTCMVILFHQLAASVILSVRIFEAFDAHVPG